MGEPLSPSFFCNDALELASQFPGFVLCRRFDDGQVWRATITEIEVYRGEEDLGCHASKGRTPRTETMYHAGGCLYVYLVYGMYWLLNVVTGEAGSPQAILIRAVDGIYGPGRLGRFLQLDKSFYGQSLHEGQSLWIEYGTSSAEVNHFPRIGIDYAGEPWKSIAWRFSTYSK